MFNLFIYISSMIEDLEFFILISDSLSIESLRVIPLTTSLSTDDANTREAY